MYFKIDAKNLTSTLKMVPEEKNDVLTFLVASYKMAAFIENKAKREFIERALLQHINEVFEGTKPASAKKPVAAETQHKPAVKKTAPKPDIIEVEKGVYTLREKPSRPIVKINRSS